MRRLLSDAAYTSASHVTAALMQLALQVYVVRSTSLAAFGSYATALAIAVTAETIFVTRSGELALQFVGRHWVAREPGLAFAAAQKIRALDWRINWTLWGALVASVVLYPGGMTATRWYVVVLGLTIPAQIGFGVSKSMFIATSRLKEQAVFEIGQSAVAVVVGVIGVATYGIAGLIVSQVVVALLKTLAAQAITRRWWPTAVRNPDTVAKSRAVVDQHAWSRFGLHAVVRNAFMYGTSQVDVLLLAAARGSETVAIYKVAKTVAALPTRAAGAAWGALRPRLLRTWQAGEAKRSLALIGWPSLLMTVGMAIAAVPAGYLADDVLRVLYGPFYTSGSVALLVLLVGNWLFGAATAWFNFWVIISEERGAGTVTYAILFLLTLGGGWTFGTRSPVAMAVAVSVAMVVTSAACWLLLLRRARGLTGSAHPPALDPQQGSPARGHNGP